MDVARVRRDDARCAARLGEMAWIDWAICWRVLYGAIVGVNGRRDLLVGGVWEVMMRDVGRAIVLLCCVGVGLETRK